MADSLRGGIVINEILVDPNGSTNFDTDHSGVANSTDEYVELYNASSTTIDISGLELWDAGNDKWFTYPAGTILQSEARALVIVGLQSGGSLPAGNPNDLFFDAGRGSAVINNGSDSIVLLDPSSNTYVQAGFNGNALDKPTLSGGYSGFPTNAERIGAGETFGDDTDGFSLQRMGDGADNFTSDTPTPGVMNTCFTKGTLLETPLGQVKVEDICVEDFVLTADNGSKPVKWIASKSWPAEVLAANPKLAPIKISKGALGNGLPLSDLIVSRQHRVLVRGPIARTMFGASEVLLPANSLLAVSGVEVIFPFEGVEYYHLMMDQHELINSNGVPTESLYLGPMSVDTIPMDARDEIEAILGFSLENIALGSEIMCPVRPIVEGAEAKRLVNFYIKNNRALLAEVA